MADKLEKLRRLESICIGAGFLGVGGFLTGALLDNDTLALISGGFGILSAIGGFYANNRQTHLEQQGYRADANIEKEGNNANNHSYPNIDNYDVQ